VVPFHQVAPVTAVQDAGPFEAELQVVAASVDPVAADRGD
jgi:hypothetical protein